MSESTSAAPTPDVHRRTRAKKACKACNARRIRCNVVEEQPCKNCRGSDVPCELIQSRRGKYERHPKFTRPRPSSDVTARGAIEAAQSPSASRELEKGEGPPGNGYANSYRYHASVVSPVQNTENHNVETTQAPGFQITPPSSTSPTATSSGQEVFLGESFTSLPPGQNKAPLSYTRCYELYNINISFEARRRAARIEYLTQNGAFTFPSNDVCEVLLEAYFSWFHPNFPIIDRHTFFNQYITKSISPLLFQAVLFVGMTHCNEKVLNSLGFPDRQEARNIAYNNAKDIYDADYETDKVIVSQALILMSFWRAGPLLEKDTRHWLGAAISLAQTKGMHRSSPIAFPDARLRKRIWWSLYIRDRQCSAALGLPTRIRDEDCDLEMLEPSDFEEADGASYPSYLGKQKGEHILYNIQMAKLAKYLGKIVLREFAPISLPRSDAERSRLRDDLAAWEAELSPEMNANATGSSFWASMLHLSYNNLYILLYRSAYLGASEGSDQDIGNIALQAACRNTRIIEDVLSQDLVQRSSVHVTTSLFNSLCIHTICLRRSKSTARKLAEYRAQLCLLGLRELQKTWDITNWVLQLFLEFLDKSTAKRLEINADNEDQPQQHSAADTPGPAEGSPAALSIGHEGVLSPGYGLGRSNDLSMNQGLDFASQLFGSKEAEDFSMFQLQPDLFSGDMFGAGLDRYYNSVLPRADGSPDTNPFR